MSGSARGAGKHGCQADGRALPRAARRPGRRAGRQRQRASQQAQAAGYPLRCIHIPKTIDNDLVGNDHTPGFPSAARFVAQAFAGANLDNAALPGVYLAAVMGRHAGFLTAASALGKKFPDDGPHLIYLPERTFVLEKFLADVKAVYERYGRCVIAVSEGIHDEARSQVGTADPDIDDMCEWYPGRSQ